MKRLLLALAASFALAGGAALGDTLTLKDGTKLDGKIVEQSDDQIVFEHTVGGATTKSSFKKSDVKSLEQSFSTEGKKPEDKPGAKPEAKPHEYGELEGYKHIVIVLDRSSSMVIADRFKTALDEVDKILNELPAAAEFGVYLFDTKPVSVFDSNNLKTKDPRRGKLRKRVEELGGVNFMGFTDLSTSLTPAIRARPDAIYLLSDGVPTRGALEAEGILKSIKDLMPTKKFPIHVVAIRGGKYEDGLEENDEVARAILKQVAQTTSGKYREVESKPAPDGRALKQRPRESDEVDLHFWNSQHHEFTERELSFPSFEVQIRDLVFMRGFAVVEYADMTLEVKTKTDAGVTFDDVKDVTLTYREIDADKKSFGLGGTLDPGEKSIWSPMIKVVRPQDSREGAKGGVTFVKIPSSGGTLEVIYRRGKKEYNKVFSIKSPYINPYTGR